MELFHDSTDSNVTLANLLDFVGTAEVANGPLVGIFPNRGTTVFFFDAEAGPVDDNNLTNLTVVTGATPPTIVGKELVCLARAFVGGRSVQLAGYRPKGMPRLDLSTLPLQHIDMAELIATVFSPLGVIQQAAALASAKEESGLDPHIVSKPPEVSVGLFQFNTAPGAAGAKFTVDQLKDPIFNAKQAFADAQRIPKFAEATTLDDAVKSFVEDFENPKDKPRAVADRQIVARDILRSQS
jgi:hypothetical protein